MQNQSQQQRSGAGSNVQKSPNPYMHSPYQPLMPDPTSPNTASSGNNNNGSGVAQQQQHYQQQHQSNYYQQQSVQQQQQQQYDYNQQNYQQQQQQMMPMQQHQQQFQQYQQNQQQQYPQQQQQQYPTQQHQPQQHQSPYQQLMGTPHQQLFQQDPVIHVNNGGHHGDQGLDVHIRRAGGRSNAGSTQATPQWNFVADPEQMQQQQHQQHYPDQQQQQQQGGEYLYGNQQQEYQQQQQPQQQHQSRMDEAAMCQQLQQEACGGGACSSQYQQYQNQHCTPQQTPKSALMNSSGGPNGPASTFGNGSMGEEPTIVPARRRGGGQQAAASSTAADPAPPAAHHRPSSMNSTPNATPKQMLLRSPAGPNASDPVVNVKTTEETLEILKAEPLDTKVGVLLENLSRRMVVELVKMLCKDPQLVYTLCEKERGKIVTQVIAVLKGEGCECLVDLLVKNINQLAIHRVACVALTRTFDALMTYKRPLPSSSSQSTTSPSMGRFSQQQANQPVGAGNSAQAIAAAAGEPQPSRSLIHFINSVISVVPELACHSHGNFVCSCILGPGAPSQAFDAMLQLFETQPNFFLECVKNKSGSHIVDAYAANAPQPCLEKLIGFLQRNPEVITKMASSDIANYPLQNVLRAARSKLGEELNEGALYGHPALAEAQEAQQEFAAAPSPPQKQQQPNNNSSNDGTSSPSSAQPPRAIDIASSSGDSNVAPSAMTTTTNPVVYEPHANMNSYLRWLVENVPRLTLRSNHFTNITCALGLRSGGRSNNYHKSDRGNGGRGSGRGRGDGRGRGSGKRGGQ